MLMQILTVIGVLALGAGANRFRGGGFIKLPVGLYDEIASMIFGVSVFYFLDTSVPIAIMATLGYYIGESLGWGSYIGAIREFKDEDSLMKEEVVAIDNLIERFEGRQVQWGVAGLTLRGIVWGIPISLALASFVPVLFGSLMGLAYLGAKYVSILIRKDTSATWHYGEYIFGAIFWAGILLLS